MKRAVDSQGTGFPQQAFRDSTVAVAATFTAHPILEPLRYWLYEVLGFNGRVELADTGQVVQTLLNRRGIFASVQDGLKVVLLRWEDWERAGSKDNCETLQLLISALTSSATLSRVPHLVCVCPPSPQVLADSERSARFCEMGNRFMSEITRLPGVFALTPNELIEIYPVEDYDSPLGDQLAWIPYRTNLFLVLASMIARHLHAATTPPYKAIVVDCDDTLWAGVCGEDGPSGMIIDEAHKALQEFLLSQHDAGMLICLCSKNNEEDVFSVFEQRDEMVLNLRHIAGHRINWESKANNIKSLASELGFSPDAFIFIDNNPLETAQVREALPEVLTLTLPADPRRNVGFLRGVWAFDRHGRTQEDGTRTIQYRQERERRRLRGVTGLTDFLAMLDLKVHVRPLDENSLARSAQLTQRVSQFNLSTIRRSEAELTMLWRTKTLEGRMVEVSDRFGDYGLVGLLLFNILKPGRLRIDSFLLSCRALGRGVEHQMLAALGSLAQGRQLEFIELPFVQTARNRPMRDFLSANIDRIERLSEAEVYLVPAVEAASIRYDPSLNESPRTSSEINRLPDLISTVTAAGKEASARSRLLERIATELSEPVQILAAFESWQRTTGVRPDGEYIAPEDNVQRRLSEIWAGVLGIEKVGVRDVFFELEGDSLKMVQVIVRVADAFGVELPIDSFFEHPTIEAHARKIVELLSTLDSCEK